MSEIEREIASQPDCWRQAEALAAESVLVLPHAGERVVALGCGTSWFVAQAYAARRAELHMGLGVTDAFTPTELPVNRPIDRTIVISRSGTTTEAVRAIERMREEATLTTAITAVADSPVADLAGHTVTLDFADERSVVQTRFATSALAFLRAHLGEDLTAPIADARARAHDAAAPRSIGLRPLRLPGSRLERGGGERGRAQAARVRTGPHRELSGDGVPPRARSALRAPPAWSGSSTPPIRAWPTMSRPPARPSASVNSTPWRNSY